MSGKKRNQREDLKQEDVLQAVVIADSFDVKFSPITRKTPRVLLPLVNSTLLDYTLECLGSSGVQDAYVFCCSHQDQVREHLSVSKWSRETSPMLVTPVVSEDCLSLGDAMREVESQSLLKGDFILIFGDTISNVQLKQLVQEHKARREKDKNCMMSMVYKTAAPGHRSRCHDDECLLAINRENNRLLGFQKVHGEKKFDFPLEMFQSCSNIQFRYDLMDCHIAICSPVVLSLFQDNFDYLTRDDFVKGILENEEILGNTIYVSILEDEYAARVSNLQMYNSVSKDVLNRWTYPLVPDLISSESDGQHYSHGRHNVYLSNDVTLARGSILEEMVTIGSNSSVGTNSFISHSVIGNNCHIGENVRLEGAYVWDGVVIENNCCVYTSLLANDVTLKQGVAVKPGCVLAQDVVVGPFVTLPPNTMLVSSPQDEEDEDEFGSDNEQEAKKEVIAVPNMHLVGVEGVAYAYHPPVDSDDDESEVRVHDTWGLNVQSDDEDDVSSESSEEDEEISPSNSPPPDDAKLFYGEVLDTLQRSVEENIAPENVVLEVNSLKHAYNIQIKEVNVLVTKAIVQYPLRGDAQTEATALLPAIKTALKIWMAVLKNYIRNTESQKDCMTALEDVCLSRANVSACLMKVLHQLYEDEVLSEDVIVTWFHQKPSGENQEEQAALRKQVAPLIKWLEEASEEESDSEEEESEED